MRQDPGNQDRDGEPVPEGIAVLEEVKLNGSTQWITIRGHDTDNPLLLFLAGGPRGSELASTRLHLSELEQIYTVVNWDQSGAAKSFHAVGPEELAPERIIEVMTRVKEDVVNSAGASSSPPRRVDAGCPAW